MRGAPGPVAFGLCTWRLFSLPRRGVSAAAALIFVTVLLALSGVASAATGALSQQGCIAEAGADGCSFGTGLTGQHGTAVSPDGSSVYAVGKASGAGQVAWFVRDGLTGDVSEGGCIAEGGADGCVSGSGLIGASGVAVSPDGANVYVASDTSNAVAVFTRNSSTGALTQTGCIAEAGAEGCAAGTGLSGATGVTVSPDGTSVYVTSEGSNAIAAFSRSSTTGALTETGCVAELGADGCAAGRGLTAAENPVVSPDGANVYTTAIDANSVVSFSRSSTGALTETGCVAVAAADGCATGTALAAADGIAISRDGSNLYVAAEASNALVTFTRNSSTGALTEQSCAVEGGGGGCASVAGLTGAARVAISADGASVYAAGYHGNTLVTFGRGNGGALTSQGCVGESGNADACAAVKGLGAPAGLAVSADGANVYVGGKSTNSLAAFWRSHPLPSPSGASAATPSVMDALGDSFTTAAYSGSSCAATADCPANSWSTGTTGSVQSHYQRLVALNSGLSGHAQNHALDAQRMSYLDTEVQAAIPDAPSYVTVLMGLYDVCGAGMTVSTMTPATSVRSEFQTAMSDLTSHLPNVKVFVASIPNPFWLWQILHTNPNATAAWSAQTVCPAMLQNPTSTASADVSRRQTVEQQVVADNQQIQQVCATFSQCQSDNDSVYNWRFAPYDINTSDYFHPSIQGQTDLAMTSWQSGYQYTTAATPPPPAVTTGQASSVTPSGATLNGTLNPEGQATSYYFQYGTSSSYGSRTATQTSATDSNNDAVSGSITGLTSSTTYHYRLVATNGGGTVYGTDASFATASSSTASYAQTVAADGPVSYWRLSETSGTTATDRTGAHPGTYRGGVTLGVQGPVTGDSAASFDGRTGYVSVPYAAALNPTRWSAEAWVHPSAFNTTDLMSVINSCLPTTVGHRGYDLGLSMTSGRPYVKVGNGGAYTTATGTAAVPLNGWTYLAATYDGATVRLYANGTQVASVSSTFATNTTTTLNLAAMGGSGRFFHGALGEAAVYNKALTATQIQNHYAARN